MPKAANNRIDREIPDMLQSLERQMSLLRDHSIKAFKEGKQEYFPEVASKLRVLLVRSRHNKPLLLEVADRLQIALHVTLRPRPWDKGPGEQIALDEFFDREAFTINTSRGLVTLTKRELIRAIAEQLGGAHEDWAVDESLFNAVRLPVYINGAQPIVIELRSYAQIALDHGSQVVEKGKQLTGSNHDSASS